MKAEAEPPAIWETYQLLIFKLAGIPLDQNLPCRYETQILVKQGEGENRITEFQDRVKKGERLLLRFFSPSSGFLLEAPVIEVTAATEKNPLFSVMREIERGFQADTLNLTLLLSKEQLLQIEPEKIVPQFGY